jgi:Outer membrane receptor proteins, mostly Fe transport
MKLKILCTLCLLLAAVYISNAQKTVTLNVHNVPANDIFRMIESQSEYTIFCNPKDIDTLFLSVQCQNVLPEVALIQALGGTPLKVSTYEKYLFVLKDQIIATSITSDFFENTTRHEISVNDTPLIDLSPVEKKATSENRLYVIGNENLPNPSERATLTGVVTYVNTGEPVVGVVLYTEDIRYTATSDAFGFYSLRLPTGRQKILIKGLGMKDTQRNLEIFSDGKLNVELEEEVFSLREIVVVSERHMRVRNTNLGVERVQISEIKNIPTAFGESDVIKIVMMLPGVKTVGEASSGFNVRGGSTDQNLILFNGGTIYNPTHLFGFFSAFNPDLVREIELYKSSIPAKYGGRISSVLEIAGREGNKKEFTGQASLGLLTSRITLEGPIGKNTSFILGGRTTYSNWLFRSLPEKSGYRDGNAGFYDLNAILDHKLSDKDNLYISGYYSHDRFSFESAEKYEYANANASLKWRHVFNSRFTGTLMGGYDHYDYETKTNDNPFDAYKLAFGINQYFGKMDFTFYLNEKHTLDFGINSILYNLNPGKFDPNHKESLIIADKVQDEKAIESAIYLAEKWDISPELSLNIGLRYSIFNAVGPREYNLYDTQSLPSLTSVVATKEAAEWKIFKTYHNPEFRFSVRYAFSNDFSIKAGINTLSQYIHKLSNTTIMSPTDTWKLSDVNIKPQRGMQVAAGIYKNFMNNIIETSVEGYYKTMNDYLDYRGGAVLSMNHYIETDVISTSGKSYGVELMVKKNQGKLNGWASYAYSRAMLRQDNPLIHRPVNNGDWYAADYDKPHEFKFVGNYRFTQRYSISLNCDYSTGRPITLPTSKFEYAGGEYAFYSERNQYRIPDFFRLDFSFNIAPSHHLTLLTHSTISIGVYNLTGRKNAYSVYYIAENGVLNGYKMAIFGAPIPYVSYNIKF